MTAGYGGGAAARTFPGGDYTMDHAAAVISRDARGRIGGILYTALDTRRLARICAGRGAPLDRTFGTSTLIAALAGSSFVAMLKPSNTSFEAVYHVTRSRSEA